MCFPLSHLVQAGLTGYGSDRRRIRHGTSTELGQRSNDQSERFFEQGIWENGYQALITAAVTGQLEIPVTEPEGVSV